MQDYRPAMQAVSSSGPQWLHPPVDTKLCPKCREEKHRREFSRNPSRKDRLHCYCKACHALYDKQRRQSNAAATSKDGAPPGPDKVCSKCGQQMQRSHFNRNTAAEDGLETA